jgi:hypothetical protein
MEWLTNLLNFNNNSGSSPFGALGGSTAMTPPAGAAAPAAPPPAAPGGMQLPGLLGKLMGQQPQQGQTGTQPGLLGQGTGNNNMLLNQAMQLMKPPQMQVPQMNLLSGPRG